MKNLLLIAALFFHFYVLMQGQSKMSDSFLVISGKVTDARTGESLAGVAIKVSETTIGTITDLEGKFRLDIPDNVNAETVVFSFLGYQELRKPVKEITGPLEITLFESEIGLNQIVISGARREEKILESPASISVVTAEQIRNTIQFNLYKNIEMLPGVDVIPTSLVSGNVTVRGFNNIFSGALLAIVDNRIGRVPSLNVNAFQLIPTNNDDIERIEVVRGPASALYGPNASTGVMHIITKSPLDMPERFETKISSVAGIERSVWKNDLRHAGKINDKLGYKVSLNYSQGHDWPYDDPAEPDSIYKVLTSSEGNDTIEGPILNKRNNFIRTYSIDARTDYRINKNMELVLTGGMRQGSNIEMTGLGAAQVINWRYSYIQARYIWKNLFIQAFANLSNAGDTYLLRTGGRIVEKSKLYVAQIQHSYKPIDKLRFTYGFDALLTRPNTDGTVNGKNEDDDDLNEMGIYLQGDYDVHKKISLVAGVRADYHTYVDKIFFSPRAAFVYKPTSKHTLRATYNRAFDSPNSLNVSMDVLQGHVPLVNIPVMAVGNQQGYNYNYASNPYVSESPVYPQYISPIVPDTVIGSITYSPSGYNHLNDTYINNLVWDLARGLVADEFYKALVASGSSLASFLEPSSPFRNVIMNALSPADIDSSVTNVIKSLDLSTLSSFGRVIHPEEIKDVRSIRNSITQSYEIGYKGTLFNRLVLTVDAYRMEKKDMLSPLTVISPNVFLDPVTLQTLVAPQISKLIYGETADTTDDLNLFGLLTPSDLVPFLDQNEALGGDNDGLVDDELTELFVSVSDSIPFGSVTPTQADNGQMFITYINVGDIVVYGIDFGATFFITEDIRFGAAYSWISKDTVHVDVPQVGYISLNAPKHKVALSFNYYIKKIGLEAGLKWRWQQGFLGNSGVYVGYVEAYNNLDINLTYRIPWWKGTEVSFSMQNVIGKKYQPFPGTPEIGRLSMFRLAHTF